MRRTLLLPAIIIIFASSAIFLLATVFTHRVGAQNTHGNVEDNLKIESRNVLSSPVDAYHTSENVVNFQASVGQGDSRPVIVDNFLARHNSPMRGLGSVFVSAADQYTIDYRLLPAIAFQESTLGKRIPRNSHNAFGWAIYTGTTSGAKFKNWEQAIFTVAKGIKANYIDEGLTTPDQIMHKYSDSEDWAFGVNFAIDQMTAN